MTVYRPLTVVDRNTFREVTSGELSGLHQRIAYIYAQSPVVTLSVVSSNGNISPVMTDTRYRSGTAARNTSGAWPAVTTFPTESQTGEPDLLTFTYDKVSQTVASDPGAPPAYTIKPVRVDGTGGVREMTETDIIDSFIDPVIDIMVSGTTDVRAAGSYFVSTNTSESNCTSLGIFYTDTKANLGAYTGSGIGTAGTYQDHFTSTDYRLFRNDGVNASYVRPLVIDGTDGLREMTNTEFNTYFEQLIKAYIYDESGYTLRYNFDGSGTTKGTAISNSVLSNVTGNFQTHKATADDYRAQEFPNGTLISANTYQLKVERT